MRIKHNCLLLGVSAAKAEESTSRAGARGLNFYHISYNVRLSKKLLAIRNVSLLLHLEFELWIWYVRCSCILSHKTTVSCKSEFICIFQSCSAVYYSVCIRLPRICTKSQFGCTRCGPLYPTFKAIKMQWPSLNMYTSHSNISKICY